MNSLKIKTERNQTRCEICHQDDEFDPEKNYCRRCSKIEIIPNPINNVQVKLVRPMFRSIGEENTLAVINKLFAWSVGIIISGFVVLVIYLNFQIFFCLFIMMCLWASPIIIKLIIELINWVKNKK